MAGVAQLVEPRIVIPVVVGSSPIARPNSLMIGVEGPRSGKVEPRIVIPVVQFAHHAKRTAMVDAN